MSVDPSSRPQCSRCKEVILSEFYKVGDFTFHKEHFTCSVCEILLPKESGEFRFRDGEFYCVAHFLERFGHVCPGCTKRIEPGKGKVVKALGFYYHQECFVCITCKTPLSGKFYTANGKPLCAEHSGKQKSRQPCPVCLKPLGQDKMLMWGRYYHKTCLECRLCKKPLLKQDKTYAVREGDAQLFLCERDYKIAHSKWCMACGEPIVGEMVFINKGEYYHQACFQCKTCCKKIDTYLCVAGELRCSDHTSASQADCTCSGCGQEIEHNKIFAVVGKKFHKDCLKCKFCSKELEPVQCRLRDGLLSCANCLLEYSLSLDQSSPSSAPSQNTPPSRLRASEIDSERIRSRSVGLTEAKQGQNRRILAKVTTHKDKSLPSPGQKSNRRETSSELASSLRESSNSILSHGTEEKDEYSGPESSASPISRRSNLLNSPSRRVNMSNFKKGELIGKGQFGKVYVALLENGQWIAVKQMDIKSEEDEAHVKAMEKEVFLMEKLRHENIVSLLGTHRDGAHFYILMEYVAGKSLDVLLKNVGPFPEVTIRWYTLQLVRALAYMHMHGIVHRDIKGKNILVDTNGTLKLADFGSAKQLDNFAKDTPTISYNYTPLWTAPEVVTSANYDRKVDIWSLGCVLIEMGSGKLPWSEVKFDNPFQVLFHIGNATSYPKFPEQLSETCKDFMRKCLTRDPDQRPDAVDLLNHQFLAEKDEEAEIEDENVQIDS